MLEAIKNFLGTTGIAKLAEMENWWQYLVMYAIVGVLFYLAIVKKFEPLLLLPIAFGMLLANLPGANLIHLEFFFDDYYFTQVEGVAPFQFQINNFLTALKQQSFYNETIFAANESRTATSPFNSDSKKRRSRSFSFIITSRRNTSASRNVLYALGETTLILSISIRALLYLPFSNSVRACASKSSAACSTFELQEKSNKATTASGNILDITFIIVLHVSTKIALLIVNYGIMSFFLSIGGEI